MAFEQLMADSIKKQDKKKDKEKDKDKDKAHAGTSGTSTRHGFGSSYAPPHVSPET